MKAKSNKQGKNQSRITKGKGFKREDMIDEEEAPGRRRMSVSLRDTTILKYTKYKI